MYACMYNNYSMYVYIYSIILYIYNKYGNDFMYVHI